MLFVHVRSHEFLHHVTCTLYVTISHNYKGIASYNIILVQATHGYSYIVTSYI